METVVHKIKGIEIAEVVSDTLIVNTADDALALMGNLYFQGYDTIILHQKNITPDFFDLKNGLAGEILQKYSTYRIRLAIIGDFTTFSSQSVKDFIYESNKKKHVIFVDSVAEVIKIFCTQN
jgi:hypothetical protein